MDAMSQIETERSLFYKISFKKKVFDMKKVNIPTNRKRLELMNLGVMNLVELQGSTRAENETRGRALISSEESFLAEGIN